MQLTYYCLEHKIFLDNIWILTGLQDKIWSDVYQFFSDFQFFFWKLAHVFRLGSAMAMHLKLSIYIYTSFTISKLRLQLSWHAELQSSVSMAYNAARNSGGVLYSIFPKTHVSNDRYKRSSLSWFEPFDESW